MRREGKVGCGGRWEGLGFGILYGLMGTVFHKVAWGVAFALLLIVAASLYALHLNAPMPSAVEAPHLLSAAAFAESPHDGEAQWQEGICARQTVFHVLAGSCAQFLSERSSPLPIRYYRLTPIACAVIGLALLPLLGLRRRGGLFEYADGTLWTIAFLTLCLGALCRTAMFEPFALLGLLFILLLTALGAYARWPGYVSASVAGGVCAVAMGVSPVALWVIALLIPAVLIGVGWTRIRLYWHSLHVLLAASVAIGVCSLFGHFGWMAPPPLPTLPDSVASAGFNLLRGIMYHGGFGLCLLAWFFLLFGGVKRREHRWLRVLVVLFPVLLIGGIFFPGDASFAAPLAVVSALLMAMALLLIRRGWVRGVVGSVAVGILIAGAFGVWEAEHKAFPSSRENRRSVSVLRLAMKSPCRPFFRVRVLTDSPEVCAQMLWTLRGSARWVAFGSEVNLEDADIVILEEGATAQLPPPLGRALLPGVITVEGKTRFRVLAVQRGAGEAS